jgi:hypothetical protein
MHSDAICGKRTATHPSTTVCCNVTGGSLGIEEMAWSNSRRFLRGGGLKEMVNTLQSEGECFEVSDLESDYRPGDCDENDQRAPQHATTGIVPFLHSGVFSSVTLSFDNTATGMSHWIIHDEATALDILQCVFSPWCSGQSSWPLTQRSRLLLLALSDFLSSTGSGTGSTQPLWG